MDQNNIENKRKYLRLNVTIKVNFRIRGKEEAAISEAGTGKNISMDGICFKTKEKLNSGALIDLEIFLPSEAEPLLLKGEVRWSKAIESASEYETGVKLATVKDSDENRYLRYVNERMMERLSRYLHL